MRRYSSKAVATAGTAFLLASSAMLAAPGAASAETKTVKCGGTVKAAPGDRIVAVTPLGVKLDLGLVTDTVGSLLNGLCTVTVTVVDTATAPLPGGKQAGDAVGSVVGGTTRAVGGVVDGTGRALTGGDEPAPQAPPGGPAPQRPPAQGTGGTPPASSGSAPNQWSMPRADSPVLGGSSPRGMALLSSGYGTGWAPRRDYSGIPAATAGLFAPSPGVRYGGQIPGYSPRYGMLEPQQDTRNPGSGSADDVDDAGQAESLPARASGAWDDSAAIPLLLAVLALSGVTAALVRTWVLRATS